MESEQPLQNIGKKYQVIYADPPWKYDNPLGNDPAFGGITYPTMETEEICNLPISELTDENCILFLWGVWVKIKDALQVMEAWGFKYKTAGFVWVKINPDGTPRTGIGNYTNSNSEFCLIGLRGKFQRADSTINQIIRSRVRKHSQKPDEVYAKIERFVGDLNPKLELFARTKRQGWDAWGNQVPKEQQNTLTNL